MAEDVPCPLTRSQVFSSHHCQLVRQPSEPRCNFLPAFFTQPISHLFYSTHRSHAHSSCLFTRSSAWACTCSNAALRPLPSSSLHLHLLRLLPPLNPDFPPSYLLSTRLRHQTTPTSIASAATGCSTAGSSAASLITCRVSWACRLACFFCTRHPLFIFFPSHFRF